MILAPPDRSGYLHVAAAVIRRGNEVLIARRPEHLHQGGLWEFPGGKVEPGETVEAALIRELDEELGIRAQSVRPLIRVPHAYSDRRVLLDVREVSTFDGEPHGREGQPLRWVPVERLTDYDFPAANHPIVTACQLPDRYLITPEPEAEAAWPHFLDTLDNALASGIRLVQFRAKSLAPEQFTRLASQVAEVCRHKAKLLLNSCPALVLQASADGVHLTGSELRSLIRRPEVPWVGASCHSREQIERAVQLGADFLVISPVRRTASHSAAEPIGWEGLQALAEYSPLPVYALGGMTEADIETARAHGAQGIAAIRSLWPNRTD